MDANNLTGSTYISNETSHQQPHDGGSADQPDLNLLQNPNNLGITDIDSFSPFLGTASSATVIDSPDPQNIPNDATVGPMDRETLSAATTALMDEVDSVVLHRLRNEDSNVNEIDNVDLSARDTPGDANLEPIMDQGAELNEESRGGSGELPADHTIAHSVFNEVASRSEQAVFTQQAASSEQAESSKQVANGKTTNSERFRDGH